ncbi:hypothetical protein CKAN_00553000 [Cinnamomum micranthum f. kanehirae]|uniref:Uncharacterized protein n=1 Tax=Cinnamomum micranthum f. kanehirae TaxID=337451 RepID=A0A443NEW6_9MAGN|nr:hypothetical protein CKAN_00553000 [Cinnamomum micranthum f. kanehirae]
MAEANFFHLGAQHFSAGVYGFNMLSAFVGLLQSTKPGSGSGSIEEKIISLSVSFSILAFAASVALPPRYTTILCRTSFFFSVLACSFLLSPFVPHVLFWVPHLACVFPLLHLLQLLPAPLRQSLQQPWLSTWNAVRDAACRVHQALLPISSSTTSNGVPERSTSSSSSSSSAAPERGIEEGDADAVNECYSEVDGISVILLPFLAEDKNIDMTIVEVLQFRKQQGSGEEGLPVRKIYIVVRPFPHLLSLRQWRSAYVISPSAAISHPSFRYWPVYSFFHHLSPTSSFGFPFLTSFNYPLLHLLQLLPTPLRWFLQQLWWSLGMQSVIVRAFEALLPTRSCSVTSNGNPGRSPFVLHQLHLVVSSVASNSNPGRSPHELHLLHLVVILLLMPVLVCSYLLLPNG